MRELINAVDYALASAGQDPTLHPKHLPPKYRVELVHLKALPLEENPGVSESCPEIGGKLPRMAEYRDAAEKKYLLALMRTVRGDRNAARRISGMSQSRLYALLNKHGLSFSDPSSS